MIEARRYRFYDVYRGRVRRLERYYYAPLFASKPGETDTWARELAADLRRHVFRITVTDAMTRRLRRNYIWILLILLVAWVFKVVAFLPGAVGKDDGAMFDIRTVLDHVFIGPLPGDLVVGLVVAFYGVVIGLTLRRPRMRGEDGVVHV